MAYSTSNPPRLVVQPIAGQRLWQYVSADDVATVNTNGYITNAEELGMKQYDTVIVVESDTGAVHFVTVVAINANGSADLTDGLAVGTANLD
jgi:hypothetical protein